MLPSELPDVGVAVVFDTEGNGLYVDDGARVSVVSVAWTGPDDLPQAYAWPFAQDVHGKPIEMAKILAKPEFRKRLKTETPEEIFGPNPNLPPDEWTALIEWLASRAGLIAHNAIHDVAVTEAGTMNLHSPDNPDSLLQGLPGVDLSPLIVWDTMIGQRVLDPEHDLGLKDNVKRLYGIEETEKDALITHLKSRGFGTQTNARYDLASWREVMEPYATWDAVQTLRLARHQWVRLADGEARFSRMQHEMRVLRSLARMERRGVPYDAQTSLRWAETLQAEVDRIAADLPFEDRPAEVRRFFFSEGQTERGGVCLNLKPVRMTAGSKPGAKVYKAPEPSVDQEVIRTLAEKGVPAAKQYQELALLTDANSRYYRGYATAIGADGRLRTRFRQTGTRNGRLSCGRTNLQAIPHDHRILASGNAVLAEAPSPRALICDLPGWRMWHMDLSQAELRVASLFADCGSMLEIIEQRRDPHGETAIALSLATGPDDPNWKAMRNVGKRGNFSLIFGIGPDRFRADLVKQVGVDLGQTRTRRIHGDWNALYPEFRKAIYRHMQFAEKNGYTPIREGIRRYYSKYEQAIHDQHKAFNSRVQGCLGEFGKAWMVEVDDYLIGQGVDYDHAGLLLNIHDALLVMVPDDESGEAMAQHCAQLARDMWVDWFPGVRGDVDVEPWSKAA